jgi:hypothetical protein
MVLQEQGRTQISLGTRRWQVWEFWLAHFSLELSFIGNGVSYHISTENFLTEFNSDEQIRSCDSALHYLAWRYYQASVYLTIAFFMLLGLIKVIRFVFMLPMRIT